MSRQRATFGKLQRERDKQAKAKAKRDRRQGDQPEVAEVAAPAAPRSEEPAVLLDLIAEVHRRYENEEIGFDEYEQRKAELLQRLPIE